eukprot:snap_masked-scaffold289_size220122-processed-gene-1.14 protein:Tk01621 transcript:snap_masked-scaffold289_size220122-processed-gene-1.14-mRNA-1 annotation:"phosphatidylinositol transfer protein alpha isoform"
MLITELRITMPMSKEEYQVGMLHGVVEASMNETGGGEGVEVLKNEAYTGVPLLNNKFNEGQYTKKIYHLESKVPAFVRVLSPKGALKLEEEAWNAHPNFCKTVITNPGYMKEKFTLKIETYSADDDRGDSENVHELTPEQLAIRKVVKIDIGNDPLPNGEIDDPGQFTSEKSGRGPLRGPWQSQSTPVMTVYKLVTIEFVWFGFQGMVESSLNNYEIALFRKFHRQIFCSIDKWFGMSMADIRALEENAKADLEKQIREGEVRGTKG